MTKFISIEKDTKEKKETVFTHYLCDDEGWTDCSMIVNDFDKVVYLGKDKGSGDVFACYKDNFIMIYKGTKGDEFN